MRRARKVMDRAAREVGIPRPLVDFHTGQIETSPTALGYLGHFPYADRVWNGEGFDSIFSGPADGWLINFSGLIHGVGADMLGGGSDYKAMLFGACHRNPQNDAKTTALWQLWTEFVIEDAEMLGWWEDDAVVRTNITRIGKALCSTNCSLVEVERAGSGFVGVFDQAAHGDITSLAGCKAACLASYNCVQLTFQPRPVDPCVLYTAISTKKDFWAPNVVGFVKCEAGATNATACATFTPDSGTQSVATSADASPPWGAPNVLVTTFSVYGDRALLVVASFLPQSAFVALEIDWDELGLSPRDGVRIEAPAVYLWQNHTDLGNGLAAPKFLLREGDGLMITIAKSENPLCVSDCAMVPVAPAGSGFLGVFDQWAHADIKTLAACKAACLSAATCVQVTFTPRPVTPCVLYSAISRKKQAWGGSAVAFAKCAAGSDDADSCANFNATA